MPEVALFATCLVDNLAPGVGVSTVRLLEAAGFHVLRIPSEDVEDSLPVVLKRIRRALAAQSPLPREGGGRRPG